MMILLVELLLVLFLLVTTATVGQGDKPDAKFVEKEFQIIVTDMGTFFTQQFNDPKDFLPKTKDELQMQINETLKLLNGINDKEDELRQATTGKTRGAINMVDNWLDDIKAFRERVQYDTDDQLNYKYIEWQAKASKMYDDGLKQLIDSSKSAYVVSNTATQPNGALRYFYALLLVGLVL